MSWGQKLIDQAGRPWTLTGREPTKPELDQWAANLAVDDPEGFAWLDGGPSTESWLAFDPDAAWSTPTPDVLDAVDDEWRRHPEHVYIGWLTYDFGRLLSFGESPRKGRLPGLNLHRYGAAIRWSASGGVRVYGSLRAASCIETRLLEVARRPPCGVHWGLGTPSPSWRENEYLAKVRRAQEYLARGDSYQINLSQRFQAPWIETEGTLASRVAGCYADLRGRAPATMGALIRVDRERWIVSNSPETLVDVRVAGAASAPVTARSWPIKGTRARSAHANNQVCKDLLGSEKDRAEHLMIVDLVRNDLGRIAVPGTVLAPSSPSLMCLPTVNHLVSEVRCSLPSDWSLASLMRAVFPGGSVTGAPKRRTMAIIDELEGECREIYCGAVVLLAPDGMRASIPIRTGLLSRDGLWIRSGGGIVMDSDPEQERLETLAKLTAFAGGTSP